MRSYQQFKARLLKDKEIRKEYERLGPEFELVRLLIRKRLEKGFTQQELARKIGTKQSAISRLESGTYNPTMSVLRKVAKALGSKLEISIR
ncbi:MAG TPA: helix-turn-helix transcriptional regulator [Candidatus Paceibacterota bacterium]